MTDDKGSLLHIKWNAKYYIVLASKYRKQETYERIKQNII